MADASQSRRRALLAFALMLCGVLSVYFPSELWSGDSVLHGMDFWVLHLRRIQFVHENAAFGSLPGWYPRELLGTPFWSNLQSFPWIPSRLLILALDPVSSFTAGVNLGAVLAATFAFLYARSIGWGGFAAAATGWTFACAGFYAARVTVGHLPLLEAYPALPMLLWLSERALRHGNRTGDLLALAVGTACTVVAGHPQLPAYALVATLGYLGWVGRRGQRLRPLAAMALGATTTLAVWWPMLKLLARSTRTLALDAARNDLAFPFERIPALWAPWIDGWPRAVHKLPAEAFVGFPSSAYFWDTHVYVGVAPWLAAAFVVAGWGFRRPGRRARYFFAMGLVSLALALPVASVLGDWIPGTYLRSPARLLYLTTFALCLALGAALEVGLRSARPRAAALRIALAVGVVAAHAVDLSVHDRPFLYARPRRVASMPTAVAVFGDHLGSARIAVDYHLSLDFNRRFDDIGFFDSIMLARPYRAVLALAGLDARSNLQTLDGSALPAAALTNLGVQFVVSGRKRNDLPLYGRERYSVYYVPHAAARAAFFGPEQVLHAPESEMLDRISAPGFDLRAGLLLPESVRVTLQPDAAGASSVGYERPGPDRIVVRVVAARPGYVRVLESWDPGWSASIDGAAVPALRSDTFAIAVAVEPGEHEIELVYRTPGRIEGAAGSAFGVVGLLWLLRWNASTRAAIAGRATDSDAE